MDHLEAAERCAERVDDYANRDNVNAEIREQLVSYNLRMAEIHATIAVAQRLDTIIGLVFDERRAIIVRDEVDRL